MCSHLLRAGCASKGRAATWYSDRRRGSQSQSGPNASAWRILPSAEPSDSEWVLGQCVGTCHLAPKEILDETRSFGGANWQGSGCMPSISIVWWNHMVTSFSLDRRDIFFGVVPEGHTPKNNTTFQTTAPPTTACPSLPSPSLLLFFPSNVLRLPFILH